MQHEWRHRGVAAHRKVQVTPMLQKYIKCPIPYDFSANGWMTRTIFEKWLVSRDRCLQMEKRKVVLLVDNCSAHYSTAKLNNISLRFLPPNTTSVPLSCDMGIIRILKAYFRHKMRQKSLMPLMTAKIYLQYRRW